VVGAGNLGYGISKAYRRKGYGSILFKELLKKCKDFGYTEIKLFPLKTNEATVKIMIKNGGKIIRDFKEEKYIISIPTD
ncbi:MAG: GNAT family N-acetyltransferase, partial [Clostridia bacterium]|nr:GNAT family N-acetyltransferase [Clostridia bacterium]